MRKMAQIFVAFSEKLNFNEIFFLAHAFKVRMKKQDWRNSWNSWNSTNYWKNFNATPWRFQSHLIASGQYLIKRQEKQDLFKILNLDSLDENLATLSAYQFVVPGQIIILNSHKVHIFWEGPKFFQNILRRFDHYYIRQIYGGDFTKFCGLLRIYEL